MIFVVRKLFDEFGLSLDTCDNAELFTRELNVLKSQLDAIGLKTSKNLDPLIFITLVLEESSESLHLVTQALSKIPKHYLMKLDRNQLDILKLLRHFLEQYPRQGKLTDKNIALNNLDCSVPTVNYIQSGDQFALKASSFYRCGQFHLAIRFWREAYHLHLKWLKPNVKSLMSSSVTVYLHPICGKFYWNLGNGFFKLGMITEALFNLQLCLFIQENMQTPILGDKTEVDIRVRISQVEDLGKSKAKDTMIEPITHEK